MLLPLFAAEAGRRLDAVDAGLAAERRDYRSLAREAHTVRGSAAVLGLDLVAEEAKRLEDAFLRARTEPDDVDAAEARATVGRIRTLLAAVHGVEEVPPQEAPSGAAGRVVLCVEDSEVSARLVRRVLEARGADVVIAANGGEADRLARERRPDVVLLDVHLPDMSGEDVVRRLAARPETRQVPVVVMTGGADEARFQRLAGLGVRGVLAKPFTPDQLVAAIDAALATSHA
jgi:CheY-like chemotaxis protein/HPt (histidine-containing phosphotransfer) domain-containing protein